MILDELPITEADVAAGMPVPEYKNLPETLTGQAGSALVADVDSFTLIRDAKVPEVVGAPAQSEDSYATFAPGVVGNPIDGVPGVVVKPSQAVINTTTQAADAGNPLQVTPENAQFMSKAFNNPRYSDNSDAEVAATQLSLEESEYNPPVTTVIAEDAPEALQEKVVNDSRTFIQKSLDFIGQRRDPESNPDVGYGTKYDEFSQFDELDQATKADLEASVDYHAHFSSPWQAFADKSKDQYEKAYAAGDFEEATKIQNYYDYQKQRRLETRSIFSCIQDGTCAQDNPILTGETELLTQEDLLFNPEILQFMAKTTGGAYDQYGQIRSPETIRRDFSRLMRIEENNLAVMTAKAIEAAYGDEESQKEQALKIMLWDMVKGTGEGSAPLGEQVVDIATAVLTDPTTYTTLGLAPVVKTALGQGGKQVYKNWAKQKLMRFATGRAAKGGVVSAIVGGTYTGAFELADQNLRTNVGLQESVDWGQVGKTTGLGAAIGGPLGFMLSGLHSGFNNLANRYMTREAARGNAVYGKDILNQLKNSINNEGDLYDFFRRMGWSRKETLAELDKLKGFSYDAKTKVWRTAEGETWVPPSKPKFADEVYNQSQDLNTLAKDAQGGDDFVSIAASQAGTPMARTVLGQKIFKKIDDKTGGWATDLVYGGDSKLIHLGLRSELDNFRAALDEAEINTNRISQKLREAYRQVPDVSDKRLSDVLRGIAKDPTDAERAFQNIWQAERKVMLDRALKTKVLSKEQYDKFLADKAYIPRVWDLQSLTTDEGARNLSNFLSNIWNKDKDAVKSVLNNLVGEKNIDDIIANQFAPSKLKKAIAFRADEDRSVLNSTHLDFKRKIKVPRELEPELDQFMAPLADRMTVFFDDTLRRTSLAARFGNKHQWIANRSKDLRAQGKAREADALEQYFYTNTNDPRSKVIQSAMNNAVFSDVVRRINAYQTISKMGLAQILNATQVFVNGSTMLAKQGGAGILIAPFKALNSIRRAAFRNKNDFQLAYDAGVLGEMDMQRIATENAIHGRIVDVNFKNPILKAINEPTEFLRRAGFLKVEEINRVAANALGNWQIRRWHSDLQQLLNSGKGKSQQAAKLWSDLKKFGIKDPMKAELRPDELNYATFKFNREINFSGETINLPSHWKTPLGKLLTKFKSFSLYQSRFLKRHVLDEAFIHGNIGPLVTYLTTGAIGGTYADQIRTQIKLKDLEDDRPAIEAFINGVSKAGGFGLFMDTLKDVGERGGGLINVIAGPTLGDIERLGGNVAQGRIDKVFDMITPAPIPDIERIIKY